MKEPRVSYEGGRGARLQSALNSHQDAIPFPAGCASLSSIKICTYVSITETEQARRNWKLPQVPHQERACCPGSESCVMPGHSLNFSGTLPTRLGTGWTQMASKLCPGRHSHLKSCLISSSMYFLSSSWSRGKWWFQFSLCPLIFTYMGGKKKSSKPCKASITSPRKWKDGSTSWGHHESKMPSTWPSDGDS